MKQLKKSDKKIIAGVCGGIADFFKIDATIVRLIVAILTVITKGGGILLYIVAALIMPAPDGVKRFQEDDIENLKSANVDDDEMNSDSSKTTSDSTIHPRSDSEFNSYFGSKD